MWKALWSGFAFFFLSLLPALGAAPLAVSIDYDLEDRTYVLGSNVGIFFLAVAALWERKGGFYRILLRIEKRSDGQACTLNNFYDSSNRT